MLTHIKTKGKILLVIAFILIVVSNYQSQTQKEDFLEQKIKLTIKTGNLFQICGGLANEGIPVGFEGAIGFDISGPKNVQVENGTLKEVLESITKQDPTYTWEVNNGVVNIYPVQFRDETIKSLLEKEIANFSTIKATGRDEIAKNIKSTNEINFLLKEKQIQFNISTKTNLYAKDGISEFNLSNIELKGVLNKIVKESSDSKLWSITKTKEGSIFLLF